MSDATLPTKPGNRLNKALDWTVFTLGAVSLTVAVAATILTRSSLLG